MNINRKLGKVFQLLLLFSIALILFFWKLVGPLIPDLTIERILGIMIGLIGGIFLYFDSRITDIIKGPVEIMSHHSLSDCFQVVSTKINYVDELRIHAISTGMIQPLVSSSNFKIKKCKLILRKFSDEELTDDNHKAFNSRIQNTINEWKKLQTSGIIQTLEIHRFEFLPTEYHVIFDSKFIISGLYTPNRNSWSSIDVEDPMVINNNTGSGNIFIKNHIKRFDKFITYINT